MFPNLVDTLSPSADGSNKTVLQAKTTWTTAGFLIANLSTNPAGAANSLSAVSQTQTAYTCAANVNATVIVGAQ